MGVRGMGWVALWWEAIMRTPFSATPMGRSAFAARSKGCGCGLVVLRRAGGDGTLMEYVWYRGVDEEEEKEEE